jgi:hypothetical protein
MKARASEGGIEGTNEGGRGDAPEECACGSQPGEQRRGGAREGAAGPDREEISSSRHLKGRTASRLRLPRHSTLLRCPRAYHPPSASAWRRRRVSCVCAASVDGSACVCRGCRVCARTSLRSTCGGRSAGRTRRTPASRSTSAGRSRAMRGWSLRSRRSTCAPAVRRS